MDDSEAKGNGKRRQQEQEKGGGEQRVQGRESLCKEKTIAVKEGEGKWEENERRCRDRRGQGGGKGNA